MTTRHTGFWYRVSRLITHAGSPVELGPASRPSIRVAFHQPRRGPSLASVDIHLGAFHRQRPVCMFPCGALYHTFYKAPKSKRVVAVRRSKNGWMATPTTSFRMTTIACGCAAGFVVPPVSILPGKTVSLDILQGVEVPGAGVTGTPTGFLNMELFELWLSFFAAAVSPTVKHPLILVMDGCGSHYSSAIIEHATKLQVVLVCLPANATHLFQPLDAAVFASFKGKLRVLVNKFLDEDEADGYSIDKATAMSIACMAWKGCMFATNVKSGFEVCGLFPLSLVNMQHRMDIYTRNGTPADIRLAAWLQAELAIRRKILTLPLPATKSKGRKRKTAPVSGHILTAAMMKKIGDQQQKKKSRGKKSTPQSGLVDIVESVVV